VSGFLRQLFKSRKLSSIPVMQNITSNTMWRTATSYYKHLTVDYDVTVYITLLLGFFSLKKFRQN